MQEEKEMTLCLLACLESTSKYQESMGNSTNMLNWKFEWQTTEVVTSGSLELQVDSQC